MAAISADLIPSHGGRFGLYTIDRSKYILLPTFGSPVWHPKEHWEPINLYTRSHPPNRLLSSYDILWSAPTIAYGCVKSNRVSIGFEPVVL